MNSEQLIDALGHIEMLTTFDQQVRVFLHFLIINLIKLDHFQ